MSPTPAPVRIRNRVREIIVWGALIATVPLIYLVLAIRGGRTP